MPELTLRALTADDAPALRAILATPEVARWWGADIEPGWPLHDDSAATRWTIEVDGAVAGLVQFAEDDDPRYRRAGIDIFLDPRHHGRGLGTEALRRVVDHLVTQRGHHRITIDPAAANAVAIRSYEKAGFTAVGVMHAHERDASGDGWHDGLLMELVVDPGAGRRGVDGT